MDYFDFQNKIRMTSSDLLRRGLPSEVNALALHKVYPVKYEYTSFDVYTEKIVPDEIVIENGFAIQRFHTTPLSGEYLEKAKKAKLREIIDKSDEAGEVIEAKYSDLEIKSWPTQQAEAEIVLSGGTLPEGSLIASFAEANNTTVVAFAQRIMQNVEAAKTHTRRIVSLQQGFELAVKSATSVAEVHAIVVDYAEKVEVVPSEEVVGNAPNE